MRKVNLGDFGRLYRQAERANYGEPATRVFEVTSAVRSVEQLRNEGKIDEDILRLIYEPLFSQWDKVEVEVDA